jgi:hypothetical protein
METILPNALIREDPSKKIKLIIWILSPPFSWIWCGRMTIWLSCSMYCCTSACASLHERHNVSSTAARRHATATTACVSSMATRPPRILRLVWGPCSASGGAETRCLRAWWPWLLSGARLLREDPTAAAGEGSRRGHDRTSMGSMPHGRGHAREGKIAAMGKKAHGIWELHGNYDHFT